MPRVKDHVAGLLGSRWLAWVRDALTRDRLCIFTLHRFRTPRATRAGMALSDVRDILERLRRERYRLVSLEESIRDLLENRELRPGAVAITIDDGYADVADAADVLLAYDCPATVFLSTDFVNGETWHWWDQIEFICATTRRTTLALPLGRERCTIPLGSPEQQATVVPQLWERCKHVTEREKWRFIRDLAGAAEVDLPRQAPGDYMALTWNDVRALEARGLRFGPHGRTHPILSQTTDDDAASEVAGSWQALQTNTVSAVPILAYPNGGPADFGDREIGIVRRLGLTAAVTTMPGFASADALGRSTAARFRVPRIALAPGAAHACFMASGAWRLTQPVSRLLRSVRGQGAPPRLHAPAAVRPSHSSPTP